MTTILVANRGEIAVRIFRTAKRMGMRTVAVYSDADVHALHVRTADEAVHIGPASATESYLRRDRIIEAAMRTRADLVHPGYGFLAEDDRFAADCERSGLRFVGPPSAVLRAVGDKASARALAIEAEVPVIPGYTGDDQSDEAFVRAARDIGFPVLVKPAGGGGGKGMTVVRRGGELVDALAAARRIASAAFDDERLILERYLDHPRHVEVQVFADTHGAVLHLGERDCSLQRRHQKILEESPAPNLEPAVRSRLHDAAVAFARHASYVGAGTCEFLVSGEAVGFIECNARLQVEHPVTEAVTGLDLVELQLRVAQDQRLPITQDDVRPNGHAIEVRVYAESPEDGFLPQAGRVEHVRWPSGLRIDAGVEEGSDVTTHYDPLLAKLIVHGDDRHAALVALREALDETQLLGVRTNLTFLAAVSGQPAVTDGTVATDWLDDAGEQWRGRPDTPEVALALAAAAEAERVVASRDQRDPWSALGAWRAGIGRRRAHVVVRSPAGERSLVVEGTGPLVVDDRFHIERGAGCHDWTVDGDELATARGGDGWFVWAAGAAHEIPVGPARRRSSDAGPSRLESPLPGRVIAVRVTAGDRVVRGQELAVVEAMKMEHSIVAPADGAVKAVLCSEGDQVERGASLIDFEPDPDG